MEHVQASTFQLPLGLPIIPVDANDRSTGDAASSISVGKNIAHHFVEFRRVKRSSNTRSVHPNTVSPSLADNAASSPSSTVSGFRATLYCCRTCRVLLPVTSFYPSHLKRSTFYCKSCCVAKKQASAHKALLKSSAAASMSPEEAQHRQAESNDGTAAAAAGALAPTHPRAHNDDAEAPQASDPALRMLNRLRRMCARPSGCGFRIILSNPVSLDFDVKVARQLLLWWNATSALGPTTEADHELRFVPWLLQQRDDPTQPLQPWEVIPVTRVQASRLTSTPTHLWAELLEPSAVAHVASKIAELKRVIADHRGIQFQSASLPSTESDASNAMCLT